LGGLTWLRLHTRRALSPDTAKRPRTERGLHSLGVGRSDHSIWAEKDSRSASRARRSLRHHLYTPSEYGRAPRRAPRPRSLPLRKLHSSFLPLYGSSWIGGFGLKAEFSRSVRGSEGRGSGAVMLYGYWAPARYRSVLDTWRQGKRIV
jgi:hypothetical protein